MAAFNRVSAVVSRCTTITVDNLAVPAGHTLTFNLRTESHLTFTGTVSFGSTHWNGPLMAITGDKVVVTGGSGHVLHGHGELNWDGKGGSGSTKSLFMAIRGSGSVYNKLHIKNCPERCVALDGSNSVELDGFIIDITAGTQGVAAKGKEVTNTDGFDIAASHGVTVKNARVINQDDCVAINSGTNMIFETMNCQGSHGLSIANGVSANYADNVVSNITLKNSVMQGGMHGIRLKTCNDGGPGIMDRITYQNIVLRDVTVFGIIVEQDYSWKQGGSGVAKGNVPISNVLIERVSGTMDNTHNYSTAVKIFCAENAFRDVTLKNSREKNSCNVHPTGFNC